MLHGHATSLSSSTLHCGEQWFQYKDWQKSQPAVQLRMYSFVLSTVLNPGGVKSPEVLHLDLLQFNHNSPAFTGIPRVIRWLRDILVACKYISEIDLLRQLHVLPHWDRSCRSKFLSHPVTVYWHRANQSQHWSCNARQCRHWRNNFKVTGSTWHGKWCTITEWMEPKSDALKTDALQLGQQGS